MLFDISGKKFYPCAMSGHFISIGPWDFLLIVVVSVQATILAYIFNPKLKAFVLSFPFPFTIASLALGRRVDATNALGLIDLLLFTHGVRILNSRWRVPIVPSIVIAAVSYCIIGWIVAKLVPSGDLVFWSSCLLVVLVGLIAVKKFPYREDAPYRTALPVFIKLPIIMAVVIILVIFKKGLGGFMTVFPMVGVIAVYEGRSMLSSMCRQIPGIMITLVGLMMVARLTYGTLGLAGSLVAGWAAFLLVLKPINRWVWETGIDAEIHQE